MTRFPDPLILEYIGPKNYRLVYDFRFFLKDDGSEIITCPAGSLTDFASIPQIFWNVFPPDGEYGKDCVIHDANYKSRGFGKYTRKQCDDILLLGMRLSGVGFFTRHIIHKHVRMWGWYYWNKSSIDKENQLLKDSNLTQKEVATAPQATTSHEI